MSGSLTTANPIRSTSLIKLPAARPKLSTQPRHYRDGIVAKLPKAKREAIAQRRTKIKQSGVTGVTHVVAKAPGGKKSYDYWQAAWQDNKGVRRTAKYSISRYGEKEALSMAKKARAKAARASKKK